MGKGRCDRGLQHLCVVRVSWSSSARSRGIQCCQQGASSEQMEEKSLSGQRAVSALLWDTGEAESVCG